MLISTMQKNNITYCCKDCGFKICLKTALYGLGTCYSCSKLGNKNPMFGIKLLGMNSGPYIDGRCLKSYFCIDCNKRVGYNATRCLVCRTKNLHLIGKLNNNGKNNGMFGIKGKNNPSYIHGKSKHPYPLEFETIKPFIRKRDNFTCQNPNCNITEQKHLTQFNRKLAIHHIDYNKENCGELNLITVCLKCNLIANGNKEFDRDYWFAYYSYIMENFINV